MGELVPEPTVLIEEHDGLSRRSHARPRARRLDFHQRDEAVDLRFLRNELGQDTPKTQRVLAECRSRPVVTGGRRVALVEYQVDNLEHRRQSSSTFVPPGNLERDVRLG
jgi:hypothetical protein